MEAALRAVVAAGLQNCRQAGAQCDAVQVAYAACLIEEQKAWGSCQAAASAQGGADEAAGQGQQQQQQQQEPLTLCTSRQLPEAAVSAMAQRLSSEVLQPPDPAAAATACLQVSLEAVFKEQQAQVEAEQSSRTGLAARLAAKVVHKKVNLEAAGLPLYQSVFELVVDYVSAAVGLEPKTSADGEARAQVAAAVESAFPLSGLAYFLTLSSQERQQQLESLAAVTCGICLFHSYTGSAPSPLPLPGATQLLQAGRLLAIIQAAAADAEAALRHYNLPPPGRTSRTGAAAGEAAGGLEGGSSDDDGCSSEVAVPPASVAAAVRLGAALFCSQAAVTLRRLAADLGAGLDCCRALSLQLEVLLSQAAGVVGGATGVSGAAVAKDAVLPLFESAGHLHQALTGELRLLLVRARLWEATCGALDGAAARDPKVPRVIGFKPTRRLTATGSMYGSRSSHGGGSMPNKTAGARNHAGNEDDAVGLLSELPAGMEFIPPPPTAAAATDAPDAETASDAAPAEAPQLALCGMCPVSLASSVAAGGTAVAAPAGCEQVLVGCMAQAEVGTIRYQGRVYGFCSRPAVAAFVEAPELVLDAVHQAAHAAPMLYNMLAITPRGHPQQAAGSPGSSHRASSAASARPGSAAQTRPGSAAQARPGSPGLVGAGGVGAGPQAGQGLGTISSPVEGQWRGGTGSALQQQWRPGSSGSSGVRWAMPQLRVLLDVMQTPLKVDAGTQTLTHLVERLVDKDYEWNEWALRRRVIALAHLRNKATHSAQTVLSAFRREGDTQTWLPKQAGVQTRVNRGSSVPRKLRYVTGLRGGPDSKVKVVALELDVHGQGAIVRHKPPGRL